MNRVHVADATSGRPHYALEDQRDGSEATPAHIPARV
jgi:hypothetical protein